MEIQAIIALIGANSPNIAMFISIAFVGIYFWTQRKKVGMDTANSTFNRMSSQIDNLLVENRKLREEIGELRDRLREMYDEFVFHRTDEPGENNSN